MSDDEGVRESPASPPAPTVQPSLALRILYMVVFAVVFWIVCWTLAITAIAQLALTLLGGRPNPDLVRFGAGLASYSRQIIEFLTFASERIPYPFTEWPTP